MLIQARDDYLLTTQWIYDITQEFAYQFQGFCQFRSQHSSQNPDTLRLLQANKEAWTLPAAVDMLAKLVRGGRVEGVTGQSPMSSQLAYFATIELARLECLIGDHSASLNTISRLHITERNELFATLPICMFNVYYHIAVCHMLSKAHASALDVFSDIILYVLRILKPGAGYTLAKGVPQTLHRMLDKALHLTALLLTITPSYAVDDQVRDAVNSKCEEKMRRLRSGEKQAAVEMWESNCPKFISPLVDYGTAASAGHSVFELQSSVLIEEVMQHVGFIKLRSYLSMYASVDIGKLARIMEVSEGDLVALLLSYKHKYRGNRGEVDFHIDGDVLVVQSSGAGKGAEGKAEKFFVGGVRKHEEISRSLKKTFASLGL
ncbi:hypothetical protein EON64_04400 [archaeon]|nr:MAG: hypothetical protein EON64_04400 [archaeon]